VKNGGIMQLFIEKLSLQSDDQESGFLMNQHRTCYNGVYPYKIFPKKGMKEVVFSPITIFYGGNGSGKTTLLNIIAEKTGVIRHSAFGGSAFFKNYVSGCSFQGATIPLDGQILTSDDVFDYLLNVRYLNDGIDTRREELFEDYLSRKYAHHQLKSLEDYENWKESYDAKSKSQSQFVKERLMRNVDMYSNGESAMKYFVDHISENALYLLDEPENSLSIALQQELAQYISDSARFYGCQFILSTHSPILLSIENAVIYDLDSNPAAIRNWTKLENVRRYFDFFEGHRNEFI
jgi:predicted ATPase